MITNTKNWPIVMISKKVILKNNLQFKIRNFMDWYVITETVVLNCYQFNETNSTVIDIGAAIGDFSVFASSNSNKVYAIEPEPTSYQLLLQNITLNTFAFPVALHSSKKFIKLSIDNSNYHHTNGYSNKNVVKVPAISLAKFIKIHQISSPIYIKCDCEGGEYDIFNTLSKSTFSKINQITMEYHLFTPIQKKQFKTLQKTLANNKYIFQITSNPIHQEMGFLFAVRK